jgi:ribosomal protein S6E (S10)
MKRYALPLIVVLALAGCATVGPPSAHELEQAKLANRTLIEKVAAKCPALYGSDIGDEGKSLLLDTQGSDDATGLNMTQLDCILIRLETPDSTRSLIDSTRALDGRQEAEWDSFSATWSYHPDSGLNMVIVEG